MRCIIINLEQAASRRNEVANEFVTHGVDFEFFKAVDKNYLTKKEIDNVGALHSKFLSKNHPAFIGHVACWMSHVKVWRQAVENGDEMIAIFEDDAKLDPAINFALQEIENLQHSFGIVFLNNRHKHRPFQLLIKVNDQLSLGRIKFNTVGTEGYIITNQAMQFLLDNFPNFTMAIDKLVHAYWIHGLDIYYLKPTVVFHGDDGDHKSTIKQDVGKPPITKRRYYFLQELNYLFGMTIPKRLAYYRQSIKYKTNVI